MTDTEYIQITHRELPYTTFDADNHLYENQRRAHEVPPAASTRASSGTSTIERPDQARDPGQDQRLHPEPDVRQGRGARRRRLRRHQGRRRASSHPGAATGFGKMVAMPSIDAFFDPEPRLAAHEGDGHRPHAAVADARQRRSRSAWPTIPTSVCAVIHALTSGCTSTGPTLLRRHLLHADHQPRRPATTRAIEELEYIARARRQDLPDPGRAGAHVEGPQVVRAARVRPVLAARAGARPRRRHALGRLRATPATPTSGKASATRR